jgi:hypothetical protein
MLAYGLFIILVAGLVAWATGQFLVPERALTERELVETNHGFTPDSMLFISEWRMRRERDGVVLVGQLKNVSGDTLEYVELQFALLDTRGSQVGAANEGYSLLPPDQVIGYRIPIGSPAARQARLLNVITPYSMTYGHMMDGTGSLPAVNDHAANREEESAETEQDFHQEQL